LFGKDIPGEKSREDRDIQRHREVVVRQRGRERERAKQTIEADAGADTKTTTKMWKIKIT
jgi:predicted phosphoribosyltransferase